MASPTPSRLNVLCQLFYPELISTGQPLTELCEVLSDKDNAINVFCGPPTLSKGLSAKRSMTHHGIHIQRLWSTRFSKLFFLGKLLNHLTFTLSCCLWLLKQIITRSKTPVLVLTNPPMLAFCCAIARRLGGPPFIYLIFDVYPETAIALQVLNKHGFLARLWRFGNRYAYQQAASIVVIGRCMKQIIAPQLTPDQAKKLTHIHVWADDTHIQSGHSTQNPYLQKWGLDDKFVCLYSGNMGRFHDMETIMEAATQLRDHDRIRFVFVGEGHKKAWAMAIAKDRNLTHCQFHGYVPRADLPYSLGCASVGLVSLCSEQVGLSVPSKSYGLLAAGVPIVGILPKDSEIALIIQEHGCGQVIQPGHSDALAKCLIQLSETPQSVQEMRKKANACIQAHYTLNKAAETYKPIIESLQPN